MASRMSSGPVEQFRPIRSTSSASSVASTALMSVPSNIFPPWGSSETLHWIGTLRPASLNASRGPKPPLLARDLARDLVRLDVDLVGVLLQPPFRQLQARGLEGVGLEHLGAGLDH